MAFLNGTLHQTKNGTLTVPPPMETRPLIQPVNTPTELTPAKPGNWREGLGFAPIRICAATM